MPIRNSGDLTTEKPLFEQIVQLFSEKIASGEWPAHTKLKDEITLADELGVSRGTLRKSIKELIRKGMLVQMKGRGTFVLSRAIEQPLASRLVSFSEAMREQGLSFTTAVLACERITAEGPVRLLLDLPNGSELWHLKRVRSVDGKPLVYLENFVPLRVLNHIDPIALETTPLFHLIEHSGGYALDWGKRYFKAVASASPVSGHLQIPDGYPLLFLEQIVYSSRNMAIEYSHVWINSAHFDVVAVLNRH